MADQLKAAAPAAKPATATAAPAAKAAMPQSASAEKQTAAKPAAKAPKAKKAASKKPAARKPVARAQTKTPAEKTVSFSTYKASPKAFLPAAPSTQTMEKLMSTQKNQFEKFTQEATAVGKDGMEAFVKSGSIFWNGFESIMKTCANLAQEAVSKQIQAVNKGLAARTLTDWNEIQTAAAQDNFNDYMSAATRISELSVKVATDSFEPINAQLSKSIKKATESMAA